ncbi:MAG TPA: hypothetical protein VKU19_21955 [Bryobacteraceae bacterium]|nr:hypothetical protein [Bryobacteraceae bacterium]
MEFLILERILAVLQYLFVLRVPLLIGLLLIALPLIAFFTPVRTLLRGLFDLTPASLFVVTLTAFAVSGMVCVTASTVWLHGPERFRIPAPGWEPQWWWVLVAIPVPLLAFSLGFSKKQGRWLPGLVAALVSGSALALLLAWLLTSTRWNGAQDLRSWLESHYGQFLAGYVDLASWRDHMMAAAAFAASLTLYGIVGVIGRLQLGKGHTVPVLSSALMLILNIGWMAAAVAFFFDAWRVPIFLVFAVLALITAQSRRSDHYYTLRPCQPGVGAPPPWEAITAGGRQRVIVAAVNGGGIQASAWAAQVFEGLCDDCRAIGKDFARFLRMISSVSGGSVGSTFFLHWLTRPHDARRPVEASVESSLDEVGWGLAFPDFLRALNPWIFGGLIGRGRALEIAWRLGGATDASGRGQLDEPLGEWNGAVKDGVLPAIVMNGTLVESGKRFLLGTTLLNAANNPDHAWVTANQLHTIDGKEFDVGVVTAARLSSTFTYVTPVSRAQTKAPMPHIADGGYYDNFGMATLVEWLDEALRGAEGRVSSVLVLQIRGNKVGTSDATPPAKNRGWFFQAMAPFTTLLAVRDSGQVAHNNIELALLQQKWAAKGVDIQSVTFEFGVEKPPLTWHLTPEEIRAIRTAWQEDMTECREAVKSFVEGES